MRFARPVCIMCYFPHNSKIFLKSTQAPIPFLRRFGIKYLNVARSRCHKSVRKPNNFDLVHQTVSPRERVGSGDETISGCIAACFSKHEFPDGISMNT